MWDPLQDLVDSIHFGGSSRPWWVRLLINLALFAALFGLAILAVYIVRISA